MKIGLEHYTQEEYDKVPKLKIDEQMFVGDFNLDTTAAVPQTSSVAEEPKAEAPKQSSITTIFVVWNTMAGTSMITIPWAYSESGILLGIRKIFCLKNNVHSNHICLLLDVVLYLLFVDGDCWK